MRAPTPLACAAFAALAALVLAGPAAAQEADQDRREEVEELEEMLRRVDAALAALEPLVDAETRLVQYDLRQLFYRPSDRRAPSLTIPGEGAGFRTSEGAGFAFAEDEESADAGLLEPDQLVEIVAAGLGEDAWDEAGASLELHRGFLLARQTDVNHARIRALLAELRGEQRGVQLEVGFYALPADLQAAVEEAALASDGVLPPDVLGELDAEVGAGRARLVGSAMLTGLNRQRVFLHQGVEQSFVSDFERSSGGTGMVHEVVADPIVEVLRTGLALDVRPTLFGGAEPDVALDVRFVRSQPVAIEQRATPWGEIDAPRVAADAVETSARVPPGAGMLVFSARGGEGDGEAGDVTIVIRPRLVE